MIFAAISIVLISIVGIWLYNRLISLRQKTHEAWSGIDVQLKRRHDLVPMLVDTVKGYAVHETHLLKDMARIRSSCQAAPDLKERGIRESDLGRTLKGLLAVAENYPALKAGRNFLELQNKLVEVEDQIQFARRYYNGTVRNYDTAIQSFPGLIIARIATFEPAEFFELANTSEGISPGVKL